MPTGKPKKKRIVKEQSRPTIGRKKRKDRKLTEAELVVVEREREAKRKVSRRPFTKTFFDKVREAHADGKKRIVFRNRRFSITRTGRNRDRLLVQCLDTDHGFPLANIERVRKNGDSVAR